MVTYTILVFLPPVPLLLKATKGRCKAVSEITQVIIIQRNHFPDVPVVTVALCMTV